MERDAYAKIAAARAVLGDSVYPDATFTLRISYGKVAGYQDGVAQIPAFTNFGGVYSKARERAGEEWYTLPDRWVTAAPLSTARPFNLLTDHDIIAQQLRLAGHRREGRGPGPDLRRQHPQPHRQGARAEARCLQRREGPVGVRGQPRDRRRPA